MQPLLYSQVCLKSTKQPIRSHGLQRLFTTFPDGWPGLGLLLLRAVVGVALEVYAAASLVDWHNPTFQLSASGILAFAIGAALLIGFITPVAAIMAGIVGVGIALLWFPTPIANLLAARLSSVFVVTIASAIVLLGPGAFSLDARLFGRREIIIPRASRSSGS